jgi:two-component system sensor histidine kinase AlgZ
VLLIDGLGSMPLALALRKVGSMFVPFVALTLFLQSTYAFVMPRLLVRLRSRLARVALHALVIVGGSAVVGEAVRPLHNAVCGRDFEAVRFGVMTVLIAVLITVPALTVQRLRNRARAVEQLALAERQAALSAQLAALQARTNPHFFFNSINTVASLITDDPALAERTLERLADLFRYALEAGKTRAVPLSREFEMVKDYLAIQVARFGDRLQVHVALADDVAHVEVPPLLLQPLVENAILHGLAQRRTGRVDVQARLEGTQVIIEVRDDGPGPGASSHHGTQTSVVELKQRLALLFGERGRLELAVAPGGGCLVTVAVPA